MNNPGKTSRVEELFNRFILSVGGELGSSLIRDTNNRPNADYVFTDRQIIMELKCLEKDLFSEKEDRERMESLLQKWRDKGVFDNHKTVKKVLMTQKYPKEAAFTNKHLRINTVEPEGLLRAPLRSANPRPNMELIGLLHAYSSIQFSRNALAKRSRTISFTTGETLGTKNPAEAGS